MFAGDPMDLRASPDNIVIGYLAPRLNLLPPQLALVVTMERKRKGYFFKNKRTPRFCNFTEVGVRMKCPSSWNQASNINSPKISFLI